MGYIDHERSERIHTLTGREQRLWRLRQKAIDSLDPRVERISALYMRAYRASGSYMEGLARTDRG